MKENNEIQIKKKQNRGKDFFVRLMAGILAILMLAGMASTLIFYFMR